MFMNYFLEYTILRVSFFLFSFPKAFGIINNKSTTIKNNKQRNIYHTFAFTPKKEREREREREQGPLIFFFFSFVCCGVGGVVGFQMYYYGLLFGRS